MTNLVGQFGPGESPPARLPTPVIPAKAGIHVTAGTDASDVAEGWTPAFTGVTIE